VGGVVVGGSHGAACQLKLVVGMLAMQDRMGEFYVGSGTGQT
jgi:hypothetical protein